MDDATDDGLLEYDVLSKDRQKFREADDERRNLLIDRARRKGKVGWNVGTTELLLGDMPRQKVNLPEHQRGEHSHAHIRTGHLHAVRYGEGKRQVRIKWFRPAVVRPDLPFA